MSMLAFFLFLTVSVHVQHPLTTPFLTTPPQGAASWLAHVCSPSRRCAHVWPEHHSLQYDLSCHPSLLLCCQCHQEDCRHLCVSATPKKPRHILERLWNDDRHCWSGPL